MEQTTTQIPWECISMFIGLVYAVFALSLFLMRFDLFSCPIEKEWAVGIMCFHGMMSFIGAVTTGFFAVALLPTFLPLSILLGYVAITLSCYLLRCDVYQYFKSKNKIYAVCHVLLSIVGLLATAFVATGVAFNFISSFN